MRQLAVIFDNGKAVSLSAEDKAILERMEGK